MKNFTCLNLWFTKGCVIKPNFPFQYPDRETINRQNFQLTQNHKTITNNIRTFRVQIDGK